MMMFQYVARRYADGAKVRGKRLAEDREELVRWLSAQSLFPLAISQSGGRQRVPKVKAYPLSVFCRELARLLDAGLPLLTVLSSLGEYSEDRAMGELVRALEVELESGTTMSEAWQLHCRTFNEIGAAVVAAGEVSGQLPKMLMTLADYLEEAVGIRAKVISALWYPATLAIAAVTMTSLFIIVVLPKMKTLLDSLNVELPLLTRCVLGFTDFMVTWWNPAQGGSGKFTPESRLRGGPQTLIAPATGDWAARVVVTGIRVSSDANAALGASVTGRRVGDDDITEHQP